MKHPNNKMTYRDAIFCVSIGHLVILSTTLLNA
jgi:hypothetical protein